MGALWTSVLLWCVVAVTGLACPSDDSTSWKFAIDSQRNQTGHWIAQVCLEHHGDTDPWQLNVNHTTRKCENSKVVLVMATITAPPLKQRTPNPPAQQLQASGYELVPGFGYYKLHSPRTWTTALLICMQEGAHLVILNSQREFTALKNALGFKRYIHIGAHDLENEGDYKTITGGSLNSTGYVNWASAQPDGGNGQNCLYVHNHGEMGDQSCSDDEEFICEKEF